MIIYRLIFRLLLVKNPPLNMCGLMLMTFKGIWHQCCRFHGTTWVWVNDGVPTVNIQKHKWDLRALVEGKIMTRILIYKCKNHMNHLNGTFIVIFSSSFPCYGINKLKFDEQMKLPGISEGDSEWMRCSVLGWGLWDGWRNRTETVDQHGVARHLQVRTAVRPKNVSVHPQRQITWERVTFHDTI